MRGPRRSRCVPAICGKPAVYGRLHAVCSRWGRQPPLSFQAEAAPPKRFARRRAVPCQAELRLGEPLRSPPGERRRAFSSLSSHLARRRILRQGRFVRTSASALAVRRCGRLVAVAPPMVEKPFVYVLRSVIAPDRYYSGLTSNVSARLAVHNYSHGEPSTLAARCGGRIRELAECCGLRALHEVGFRSGVRQAALRVTIESKSKGTGSGPPCRPPPHQPRTSPHISGRSDSAGSAARTPRGQPAREGRS